MSRAKDKGTQAETAVAKYLDDNTPWTVERRATEGAKDRGDIAGIPGVVIEVKNCERQELAQWVDEAEVEGWNDQHAPVYVVWHKRRRVTDPGGWYVTMPGRVFTHLLTTDRWSDESLVAEVKRRGLHVD